MTPAHDVPRRLARRASASGSFRHLTRDPDRSMARKRRVIGAVALLIVLVAAASIGVLLSPLVARLLHL